ncbi:AmmeMemoRadiSam system protein B [Pseudothauera nasutitermitis]|uniref:MEMO1 family protein E6C76_04615 n=1 Tax=Pseudothauera nasutitermitis TaxID=2565930 RepID=A0A4S4B1U7_9RHOO|nr:AmmeMemoRadiSam system protein B [Pseudothauera nasutitermitis]THF66145.1 AmmeMemoRadiSam system protein B [Pseudothauera nasutitermitis]
MANASIRPATAAGHYYPGDPLVLHAQLSELLSTAVALETVLAPKALIVPHGAYLYSGPVAATAYAALAPMREQVRRVVLLGPAHHSQFEGFALPAAQAFATPLGAVALSRSHWLALQKRADCVVDDHAHALEHTLEVQLPFLQTVLGGFELVPVLVGAAGPEAVAGLLDELWGGPDTVVVVSSDLSHDLSYEQARHCDRATIRQIVDLGASLTTEQACGAAPVNGLLRAATRHGLDAHLLDLRNSGDTVGGRERVVGYASVAFCESPQYACRACH